MNHSDFDDSEVDQYFCNRCKVKLFQACMSSAMSKMFDSTMEVELHEPCGDDDCHCGCDSSTTWVDQ